MEINLIQFIGDVDTHYTNASSYVIIPKPRFSTREGIHSRCRRFGSVIHRYDRCCRSRWRWRSIDRSTMTGAYSTVRHSVFASDFGCFSCIKKLPGRTETRNRERKCFQSIRTMCYISRDDRARFANCSLLTATDLRIIIED